LTPQGMGSKMRSWLRSPARSARRTAAPPAASSAARSPGRRFPAKRRDAGINMVFPGIPINS
jgi:hypothetical protein